MSHFAMLCKQLLFRNYYGRYAKKSTKYTVNLEYFDNEPNVGDALSPIIVQWMLNKKGIDSMQPTRKTYHLMALGSILGGNGFYDATVWGSGIKSFDQISALGKRRYFQKLDIRAVRGPLTRDALLACGYKCPEVYGDPAVLMPLIYTPQKMEQKSVGVILHFKQSLPLTQSNHCIDVRTNDYKMFLDSLCSCNLIVSSSLHGIILAESYGIPAIYLSEGRDWEMFKYYDWYYSTGRKNVRMASTLEEALKMSPMDVPDVSNLQKSILQAFPYDLWNKVKE